MNPPEGSSKLFLPGGIAAAVGLGVYVWTRDNNDVTGGDVTKVSAILEGFLWGGERERERERKRKLIT